MKLRGLKILAIIFFSLGTLFIAVYSSFRITGNAIFEGVRNGIIPIIGLVFLVAGIIIFSFTESRTYQDRELRLREIIGSKYEHLSERDKTAYSKAYRRHLDKQEKQNKSAKSGIESLSHPNIIRTERFERAIRGHDEEAIKRAIKKIGTGLGREEKLKHMQGYSIRVSKGARIIYDRKDREIELKDYLPDHKYAKRDPN